MLTPGAADTMAKPKKRPVGRPKAETPMKSLMSFKGTDAMELWVDELVDFARVGTRAQMLRNAIEDFAKNVGFKEPMPKR